MKTKYLLMIFDKKNTLLGFNTFLFNTKQQGIKYMELMDHSNKKVILQPLDILNTEEVHSKIKEFSSIVS